MIWVVTLTITLVAYFIYQGLHARHVSRCQTDKRTAEHVPNSIKTPNARIEFHNQSAVTAEQVQRPRIRKPQNTPSLLYADRSKADRHHTGNRNHYSTRNQQMHFETAMSDATLRKSTAHASSTRCTSDDIIDVDLAPNQTADHTLEFTAEHEPLADVGTPVENNQYAAADVHQNINNAGFVAAGIAAASNHTDATDEKFIDEYDQDEYNSPNEYVAQESTLERPSSQSKGTTENIDLELDGTENANSNYSAESGNDHDELLDFGDLTSDISDMLKELNLRETDSPRLEINKTEFEQLKTGEPGDVKPAKIENVADKLRNMLQ